MRRRELLGLIGAMAALRPGGGTAQSAKRVPSIGMVSAVNPRSSAPNWGALEQRLIELGYRDGETVSIHFLELHGDLGRYPAAMAELVRRNVDVIMASGQEAALKAATEATRAVPIVFIAIDYDPLARGYISTLARPGGNATGMFLRQPELGAKRVELLKQALPSLTRAILLWDSISADQVAPVVDAAASLNVAVEPVELSRQPYDYEAALRDAKTASSEALLVMASPFFFRDRNLLGELALKRRLPSTAPFREFAEAGGLMSYGASFPGMFRRAAEYVDRILRGTPPADLPVEQPTRFELVVNLKTAIALGLMIPPTLLARADEVIE